MDDETPETSGDLPPHLKRLQRLVTVLTVVMIGGLLVLIAAIVIRLNVAAPAPVLPGQIALPPGTQAQAITTGPGWYAVVTGDDRILIYDRDSGALRQEVAILPGPN